MGKLIIFDCDGVLIDSQYILNLIDSKVFTAIGYPVSVEECNKRFSGLNAQGVHDYIKSHGGPSISPEFVRALHCIDMSPFEKDLTPLLQPVLEWTEQQKIARGVASNSPRKNVLRNLTVTHQLNFFGEQNVFTVDQLGVGRGKPNPDIYLFAAKQMGFDPQDCIVVEDSIAGVQAGLSAGMRVIVYFGGTHAQYSWYQKRLGEFGLVSARTPQELIELLEKEVLKTENF